MLTIQRIYKRYFFDFCSVYSRLRKNKDEVNAAYITISRMQAILLWGILIFCRAIYGNIIENNYLLLAVLAGCWILTHYVNNKWIKEFKKWKSELPQKNQQSIKWNNLYLLSTFSVVLIFVSSLLLLLFKSQHNPF